MPHPPLYISGVILRQKENALRRWSCDIKKKFQIAASTFSERLRFEDIVVVFVIERDYCSKEANGKQTTSLRR